MYSFLFGSTGYDSDWNQDLVYTKWLRSHVHLVLADSFRSAVQTVDVNCVGVASSYLLHQDDCFRPPGEVISKHDCNGLVCGSRRALKELSACWQHWLPNFATATGYRIAYTKLSLYSFEGLSILPFWDEALRTPARTSSQPQQPLREISSTNVSQSKAPRAIAHVVSRPPITSGSIGAVASRERRQAIIDSFRKGRESRVAQGFEIGY